MLLDRAATLATKINTYQKLKNSAAEAEQFGTRAKQFETVSLLMAGLRETLGALADPVSRSTLSQAMGWVMPTRRGRCAKRSRKTLQRSTTRLSTSSTPLPIG